MKSFIILCSLICFTLAANAQKCSKPCKSKSDASASIESTTSQVASTKLTKKECTPEEKANCAKKCASKSTDVSKRADTKVASASATKSACCAPCPADCVKACCSGTETRVASVRMEADELAEKREDIEKRVCADTGAIGFFLHYKCSVTNEMTSAEVKYDADKKDFVRLVSEEEAAKNCAAKCTKKSKSE